MNSSFEEDIRRALTRVDPPRGFAERVMRKTAPVRLRSGRYWIGAVAAGFAALAILGGVEQNQHERRMQAEQAQRQVVFALALASEKMDHAMQRANLRLQQTAPSVTIGGGERGRL